MSNRSERACDVVAERVALGEPLGDVADHAAECPKCRRIAALPADLTAMRQEADPGLGFAARMTAGAQHRLVVRQRRRVAVAAVTAAAAVTMLTFALTRDPEQSAPATQPAADLGSQQSSEEVVDDPAELRALVQLADTNKSRRYSANWRAIQKPLAPYKRLVKGVEP